MSRAEGASQAREMFCSEQYSLGIFYNVESQGGSQNATTAAL